MIIHKKVTAYSIRNSYDLNMNGRMPQKAGRKDAEQRQVFVLFGGMVILLGILRT
mgnify:CR=1 FL=1